MIKRIIAFSLVLLLFSVWGCELNPSELSVAESTEISEISQNSFYYIVNTDWMTFYFSKKDFEENAVNDIVSEAVLIMAEIRDFLKVSYTVEQARETACYFDSSYVNDNGQNRSHCFWRKKEMYCVLLEDFVHEYVHMVTGNNEDVVYKADEIFIEGFAEYVSINFFNCISTKEYRYFKETDFSESVNYIYSTFLSEKGLDINKENYTRLEVYLAYRDSKINVLDKNSDFYKYYVGYVFVDYCVSELGGMEKFLNVYFDCITAFDVYGKTVDALVEAACIRNAEIFD